MTTPPDDLEQKVDLVLENIGHKQREGQYQAEAEILKRRLSALEREVEKYRAKESREKNDRRKRIKENWSVARGVFFAVAIFCTPFGALGYGCYRDSREQKEEIARIPSAVMHLVKHKDAAGLQEYFLCRSSTPRYDFISTVMDRAMSSSVTLENMTIEIKDSRSFIVINKRGTEIYKVNVQATFSNTENKQTLLRGQTEINCQANACYFVQWREICPPYARTE